MTGWGRVRRSFAQTRLLVTHGVSHLHKCDEIVVVHDGEMVDQGSYQALLTRSKVLREFIHSTTTTTTTTDMGHESRRASDAGVCAHSVASRCVDGPMFVSESIRSLGSIPTEPTQVLDESNEPVVSLPTDEENTKIIQKETIQTGSVSSIDRL